MTKGLVASRLFVVKISDDKHLPDSHFRSGRQSSSILRGGRQECFHSATNAQLFSVDLDFMSNCKEITV